MPSLERITISLGGAVLLVVNAMTLTQVYTSKEVTTSQTVKQLEIKMDLTSKKIDEIGNDVTNLKGQFERLDERTKMILAKSKMMAESKIYQPDAIKVAESLVAETQGSTSNTDTVTEYPAVKSAGSDSGINHNSTTSILKIYSRDPAIRSEVMMMNRDLKK